MTAKCSGEPVKTSNLANANPLCAARKLPAQMNILERAIALRVYSGKVNPSESSTKKIYF